MIKVSPSLKLRQPEHKAKGLENAGALAAEMVAYSRGVITLKEAKSFLAIPHVEEYAGRVQRVVEPGAKQLAGMLLTQWAHLSLTTRPKTLKTAAKLRAAGF